MHGFVHSTSDALVPSAARGTTYSELMHLVDLTPTLLEGVLGVRLDDAARADLDGVDQWRALTARVASAGASAPRSELLLNIDYLDSSLDYLGFYRMALRMGDWKAIFNEEEVFWYEVPPDPFKVRARLVLSLLLLLVTTTATTTTPATRPLTPPTRALPLSATRSRSSPSRRPRASSTPRSSTSRPTRTSASTARPTSRT